MNKIKSIWKSLQFDNEIVTGLKEQHMSQDVLYTHLISGKISMKEYLSVYKKYEL